MSCIVVLFHVLIHSKVLSIILSCPPKNKLEVQYLKFRKITFFVQNIIFRQFINHPIGATHNTPTSISIGKISGWESGNTPTRDLQTQSSYQLSVKECYRHMVVFSVLLLLRVSYSSCQVI